MSIEMTRYRANKVLRDDSILHLPVGLMDEAAAKFCEAAGVGMMCGGREAWQYETDSSGG